MQDLFNSPVKIPIVNIKKFQSDYVIVNKDGKTKTLTPEAKLKIKLRLQGERI